MNVNEFLRQVQRRSEYRDQIVEIRRIPPRPAKIETLEQSLNPHLQNILTMEGIENLYSHQAKSVQFLRQGKNVLVVTGTASGKTLCYNLPIVEHLIRDPKARAMLIFPTKALAQDQLATLNRWIGYDETLQKNIRVATYDGDTPSSARGKIRRSANIILTNPDMLHQGILPYHAKWADFFHNLRFVVIDELHSYRGIFGSQFANVLRRLTRLLEFHGGRSQFVCSSATIGNPLDFAEGLTGRPMELIDDDGSPRGEKFFVFWNPPYVDPSHLVRRSANIEAKRLFTDLVRFGSQSIVFTRARVVAEIIYKYAKEEFHNQNENDLAEKIRAYRGGYLPEDRRAIEKLLFTGKLRGVCATNALELGIDVGSLDAAILVGYPGTISSAWQQAGRAGRRAAQSLAILVAYNDPIDQYIMHHPEYFFNRDVERVIIDPNNTHILANHLACAAFELPLTPTDDKYFGPAYAQILETISQDNPDLHKIADQVHWASSEFPARNVNLRTISESTFTIIDTTGGQDRSIGSIDGISAPEQLYPSAVYLHEGESFVVKNLDLAEKVAYVKKTNVDYYTQPILTSSARALHEEQSEDFAFGKLGFGGLEVSWQTIAFKKIKFYTMEMIGQEALDLPSQSLRTRGFWFLPAKETLEALGDAGHLPAGGLAGLRNLLIWALPILAICDPKDLGGQVNFAGFGSPALIVYDRYLEGLGFARRGFESFTELLRLAEQILKECSCETGCPSCVGLPQLRPPLHQDPGLEMGMEIPDKQATAFLLERINASK
ncbi:MAG: DEAD/DEAH box helicase [Phycisphaerae bacterium]